jgi:hypothetical protein
MDLFTPAVDEVKLHKNFARTIGRTGGGVREVLKSWADGFTDRDGKFVREFQTTYNSSFWELYLYAVLKNLGIKVDFTFASPDFVAAAHPFAIEATIAGHRGRRRPARSCSGRSRCGVRRRRARALKALIVANEYLESEVCELMQAVSHAYARGRFKTHTG